MRSNVAAAGARGKRRLVCVLAPCAWLAACKLDTSVKTECLTTGDCFGNQVCVANTCVPGSDGALVGGGCDALPSTMLVDPPDGSPVPQWRVSRVKLPGTSECVYVDKTEVTVAEYGAWAGGAPSLAAGGPFCTSWKRSASNPAAAPGDACTQSIPSDEVDPFNAQKPIRCVDWCDAQAFCHDARAGHLCLRTASGGTAQPENQPDEWPSACTNSGTTSWPWGNTADPTLCNLNQPDAGGCGTSGFACGPAAVRSYLGCAGPTGIYDLIGNVREWLGVCAAQGAMTADGNCTTAGGGYADALENSACTAFNVNEPKSARLRDVGFRCCYSLTPAQRQMAGLP